MAKILLPILAILIALAWAYETAKLPGTKTDAEKAGGPAKEELGVQLVKDKPNSLLVPEEVRKALGIRKGDVDQIAVAELPTRKLPLVMPGSTALDPAHLIRVRVRFAPAEVVEIGKIDDPHASPGNVPPLRRDLQAGDPVKKGDLLAVLFSVDLGNKKNDLFDALSQLRLDEEVLKRAEAHSAAVPEVFLLNAKRNVQADINAVSRAENTLKTWAIPEEEIQAVRDEVKNYTSDKDRRAKEKERLKQWARVELKAPVDGFIIEQNVALHETVVDNTTNLFQIAKVDPLIVLASVPEDDLPALQELKERTQNHIELDRNTVGTRTDWRSCRRYRLPDRPQPAHGRGPRPHSQSGRVAAGRAVRHRHRGTAASQGRRGSADRCPGGRRQRLDRLRAERSERTHLHHAPGGSDQPLRANGVCPQRARDQEN